MRTIALCLLSSLVAIPAPASPTPPTTPKSPVTDIYHGTSVVDDYRWLEDWSDAKVKAWSEAQNAYTRSMLDKLPAAAALRARITEIENSVGVEYHDLKFTGTGASARVFAAKNQPPKQQPLIVLLGGPDALSTDPAGKSEQLLLDLNELDKDGGTSFDWFVPSPDGATVAVSLSKGGSESGDVCLINVASRDIKLSVVPRVNGGTAGGSLAWLPDSSGFFYSRYPRITDTPTPPAESLDFFTQVYFHKLGTPTAGDTYQTGKDYPKIAEIMLETATGPGGAWALANVQNGDGGEFIQDIRSPDGTWTRLTTWADRVVEAKFGRGDSDGSLALYLISRKDAPMGKILRIDLAKDKAPTLADARTIIPERADGSVESYFSGRGGLWLTKDTLYVGYQVGGPNELLAFDHSGKLKGKLPALPVSTIEAIEPVDPDHTDTICYHNDSFVAPAAYYTFTPPTDAPGSTDKAWGQALRTVLATPRPPHMPELAVLRRFATSKDGTKVPYTIIARRELVQQIEKGDHVATPTIVWGYGGYGVNENPGFSPRRLTWVEQGGLFVSANIRGGGEYGEKWHLEGNLTRKQNVFDDYYAICKALIDSGLTNRDKLAIMGGSNGGLLMGATFTQHPDLCKAVVSSVGIYDMLRVELSANGAFNITEFGTVTNPDHFKALYAYSPYHHVREGVKYPSILFMTGANDPRVDPMQSRKMTARVQAAQADVKDAGVVLLRTSGNTGHGAGTPLSARIEQTVDQYGFLFDQLGLEYKPVGAGKQ